MTPNEIVAHCDSDNILAYIGKFSSIETLIFNSLDSDENNFFELGNGIDDDGHFNLICLALNREEDSKTKTIAELYYDINEVKSEYCEYPLFQSFITTNENIEHFKSPLVINDESVEEFQNSIGFYFDRYLLNYVCDSKVMIPYFMSFALTPGGGNMLLRTSKNFLEEIDVEDDEIEKRDNKNIYYCNSYISHKNHVTNYNYYFIKST